MFIHFEGEKFERSVNKDKQNKCWICGCPTIHSETCPECQAQLQEELFENQKLNPCKGDCDSCPFSESIMGCPF